LTETLSESVVAPEICTASAGRAATTAMEATVTAAAVAAISSHRANRERVVVAMTNPLRS
jgi:hypothetical protein